MRERAVELAVISGHAAQDVSKTDWEQAKRELTGEPVRGSIGHKAPVTSHENEDDDGRSDSERLVEEGVKEAGHDQMLQAARTPRPENEL